MDSITNFIKSKDKKDWMVFGALICVIILGFLFFNRVSAKSLQADSGQSDSVLASSTKHASLKKYFTEQIHRKIDVQNEQYKQVKEEIQNANHGVKADYLALKKDNEILHEELMNLKVQLSRDIALREAFAKEDEKVGNENYASILDADQSREVIQPYDHRGAQEMQAYGQYPIDELETISVNLEETSSQDAHIQSAIDYVTSGTHVKGVLLGGIDAHTEVYGNNETRVVTIRFLEDGIMPNGFKAPIKNCVLLASAWGNASSERVAMRGERLSCVYKDGRVLEKDIVGIIYGPDGREDVRGRVVYPEGKLVQRAFIAGTLSGLGSGIGDGFVTKSISPLGSTSTVQAGEALNYGAAQGAQKSLDKLADYYIKRAEKLQPIVQVPAGVKVDVVFQKGFSISATNNHVDHKKTHKEANKENILNNAHKQALEIFGE